MDRWPSGVAVAPSSSSNCMMTAVDESTNPMAPTAATGRATPAASAASVSSTLQVITCAAPSPKICRRSAHSLVGRISSPMMNRNSTTPNSAVCSKVSGSSINPMPKGPTASPPAR